MNSAAPDPFEVEYRWLHFQYEEKSAFVEAYVFPASDFHPRGGAYLAPTMVQRLR